MPERSSKQTRSLRLNQWVASTVDDVTGDEPESIEPDESALESNKNPHAAALGQLGGRKGGPARALKLTAARRSEIARKAAEARWHGERGDDEGE